MNAAEVGACFDRRSADIGNDLKSVLASPMLVDIRDEFWAVAEPGSIIVNAG